MGIKDLFKLLVEYRTIETLLEPPDFENSVIFVDFNSYFYACMYFITVEEDIKLFPQKVADRLSRFLTNRTVFAVDRGKIEPKVEERDKRKNREVGEIELKILDNRYTLEKEIFDIMKCKIDVVHKPSDDHQTLADSISELEEPLILYSHNFDAEYDMVNLGAKIHNREIIYASNDQDMIALTIINDPTSIMIYRSSLEYDIFRIKQDPVSLITARLITFTTMLCNKSDYFCGLEHITSRTFLKNNRNPYTFKLHEQADSDTVLKENEDLLHDILNNIKKESSIPQYRMNEEFTSYFIDYVKKVCMYLTLDTSFFAMKPQE